MAAESKQKSWGVGFLGGLFVAALIVVLYIKFGFELPGWLLPKAKIEGLVKDAAADFAADRGVKEELQRLVGIRLGIDPSSYIEADNALGGFLTREMIWQTYTKRQVKLLRDGLKKFDEIAEQRPALRCSRYVTDSRCILLSSEYLRRGEEFFC